VTEVRYVWDRTTIVIRSGTDVWYGVAWNVTGTSIFWDPFEGVLGRFDRTNGND
jgi:hypothetical protein